MKKNKYKSPAVRIVSLYGPESAILVDSYLLNGPYVDELHNINDDEDTDEEFYFEF